MAGTGLGGTVTVWSVANMTLANWNIVSISGYEEVVAVLDDTSLGSTTFEESCPASLASIPEITINVYWEYDEQLPAGGASGADPTAISALTIAMPPQETKSGGVLVGTGFLTSKKMPDHTVGDRTIGTLTWKFDGKGAGKPDLTVNV